MLPSWRNLRHCIATYKCRHWLHQMFRQLTVLKVTKTSSKWRHFGFCDIACLDRGFQATYAINSLTPERYRSNYANVSLNSFHVGKKFPWTWSEVPQSPIDDKSTLVKVMTWCCRATRHYLSQCRPRTVSVYGVTRVELLAYKTRGFVPRCASLHLSSSPNEFSWLIIFPNGNNIPHRTTDCVLEIWSMQWRHNDCEGVLNHQPHARLFRRRSKKTSKLRVTGLCARNSPVTGEFPAQKTSNAENVSIWWRHHEFHIGDAGRHLISNTKFLQIARQGYTIHEFTTPGRAHQL